MDIQNATPTAGNGGISLRRRVFLGAALMAAGLSLAVWSNLTLLPRQVHFAPECHPFKQWLDPQIIVGLCAKGDTDYALSVANMDLNNLKEQPNQVALTGIKLSDRPAVEAKLHLLKGGALRLSGRADEAKREYGRCWAMGPDLLDRNYGGNLLAESGNRAQALARDRAAAAQAPASRRTQALDDELNNACWDLAIYPGGNPALAVKAMAPLAASHPDSYDLDTYAMALWMDHRPAMAVTAQERALRCAATEGDHIHLAYLRAVLDGFEGHPRRASAELHHIFQSDITFTPSWEAARLFETGSQALS